MASTKEYLDFVLEQLSGLDEISSRAMMGDRSQLLSTGFQLNAGNDAGIYKPLADRFEITVSEATDFSMTMIIYTQGIGSLIASGIVKDTKENIFQMIHNTGITYLKGLGAKL